MPNTVVLKDPSTGLLKEYELVFDLYSLVLVEETCGDSFHTVMSRPTKLLNMLIFLWAGLQAKNPGLAREEIGRMVPMDAFVSVEKAVYQAVAKDFGYEVEAVEGEPQAVSDLPQMEPVRDLGTGTESINTAQSSD